MSNPKDIIGSRKAPMSTVPANVMTELGVAMLEGAAKYGRHNYRVTPIRASVYYDATMRHLMAFWEGQDIDPDSGMSHITKAIASLTVWRDAMMQGTWIDDRPPASEDYITPMNAQAALILDRHADKNPVHCTQQGGFQKEYTISDLTMPIDMAGFPGSDVPIKAKAVY